MNRPLLKVLAIQILTVPLVIFIFKFSPSRQVGGLVAGTVFILGAAFMIFLLNRQRSLAMSRWLLGLFGMHLFLVAIPMVFVRLTNWDTEFEALKIWGLDGPQFHKLSERLYLVLILSTVFAIAKQWLTSRRIKLRD